MSRVLTALADCSWWTRVLCSFFNFLQPGTLTSFHVGLWGRGSRLWSFHKKYPNRVLGRGKTKCTCFYIAGMAYTRTLQRPYAELCFSKRPTTYDPTPAQQPLPNRSRRSIECVCNKVSWAPPAVAIRTTY